MRSKLIIVCCHAVWLGGKTSGDDEGEWAIEPFQAGETPTFVAHIRAGVERYLAEVNAVLVFSGGPTKKPVTEIAEGDSYLSLAHELYPSLIGDPNVVVDTLSTDSFQNLLFPLLFFHHHSQAIPVNITIVSHGFKKHRFLNLHCGAIRWPQDKVTYVGIDPLKDNLAGKMQIEEGEAKARADWKCDRFGHGLILGAKRSRRGWDDSSIDRAPWKNESWSTDLAKWDGGDSEDAEYPHRLPWDFFPQQGWS